MRVLIAVLLFLTATTVSSADTLTFATHTNPPLSIFLKEILQEALKPYGKIVLLIEMPGRRVIQQVNSGQADGDPCRVGNFKQISDDDASNYVKVKEPIVLTKIVMITRKEKKVENPSWDTINRGNVGFLRGSKRIGKHIDEKNRIPVTLNLQALKMVALGRIDSAVMFASVAKSLLHKNPALKMHLIIHEKPIMAYNQYPYFHKKHVGLIPVLEFSLQQLKEKGIFQKIAEKHWISPPLEVSEVE